MWFEIPNNEYLTIDHIVAGARGELGSRDFFIQARQRSRLITMQIERAALIELSGNIDLILDRVQKFSQGVQIPDLVETPDEVPAMQAPMEPESMIEDSWVDWIDDTERLAIIVEYATLLDEADNRYLSKADSLAQQLQQYYRSLLLSSAMAREFAAGIRAVVVAGRNPCPDCGQLINPSGHICPRRNGYHPEHFGNRD